MAFGELDPSNPACWLPMSLTVQRLELEGLNPLTGLGIRARLPPAPQVIRTVRPAACVGERKVIAPSKTRRFLGGKNPRRGRASRLSVSGVFLIVECGRSNVHLIIFSYLLV